MKYAFLVMYELRSLPKTIKGLYEKIIDYYNADVFILCQRQFEDDEDRMKLFTRNVKHAELYTKPDPKEYFKSAVNYDLRVCGYEEAGWNNRGNSQTIINNHKFADIIEPIVDNYDYYIFMRVDSDILFDMPPSSIWEKARPDVYSFCPHYCRSWGGSGGGNFIHKSLILKYLRATYLAAHDASISRCLQTYPIVLNQETYTNIALDVIGIRLNLIDSINYYYTCMTLSDYTTWSKPIIHPNHPEILCKYPEQYDEAFSARKKWDAGWRWGIIDDRVDLCPPPS